MYIFIDDERNPTDVTWETGEHYSHNNWLIIRTDKEFYNFLHSNHLSSVELISFDHDIQCFDDVGIETTGYNLLQTLIDYCIDNSLVLPTLKFHTKNIVGKHNMITYYVNALLNCPKLRNLPRESEPVLAKIKQLNSLSNSHWYEVVYFDGKKWCSYVGSNTFNNGESVIVWKYVTDCL